jgi:surface protein
VFVIAHASADPSILALADTALSGYSVAAFNGDDALILVNGSDTIDVIGVPGVDPGSSWPVGSGSTANNTLVRMIGIDQGSTDWAVGATEWDVYSSNDWTFMDSHASNCHGATPPPPTSFTVTFRVNTANITVGPNGMYAGGGVLGGANALALTDVGGGVWEGSALLNGSNGGNFAFFNSPAHAGDWGTKENLSGLSCADPGNYNDRILTSFTQDTTLLFCFGSCETDGTCPTPAVPSNVTFSVDMNQYGGSTANGVFLNGDFNSWCGSCNAMDDSDNDGVWTITLPLTADSIEYKFTVDGWSDQESLTPGSSCTKTTGIYTNRFLAISGDTTLATVCWNSCGSCAPGLPTGVTLDANGCVECDSLNVGDFFVLNGDSVEVVDRTRLLAIVAAEGDLTKVCVSHVTDMKILFKGAKWFNQDISTWDVSNVTNMVSMFFNADSFNVNISTWNVGSVENMKLMFRGASAFNQGLNRWDVSSVTNMNRMFLLASAFDGAIGNWDVSSATRMTEMFKDASSFDQDLSGWCVTNFQYNPPTNFATNAPLQTVHYPNWGNCPQTYDSVGSLATGAFVNTNGCIDCSALNVGDYFEMNGDTLLVVDRAMLDSLVLLHADLSRVCVSNITDMKDALRGLRWFNTDISAWDVSNVTDMSNMFFKSRIFNQDIGNWDVSSVTKMAAMFQVAQAFNQDIGGWDVSNVERFRSMFRNADAFNQNIGGWDVSSVLNDAQMSSMFRSADNFSQDLSMWCVSNAATKPAGFDANSALVASQLPVWGTCPTAAPSLYTITSAGQTFTPDTLYCNVGDIITFNVGSNHNAVEVSKTTYLSNGNTPLSGGFSVGFGVVDDFTPTSAGTHYYVCTPHAANNMKGVIIVSGSSSRAGNNSPIASNEVNSKVRTNPAEMPQVAAFPNPTTGMVKISPVVEGTYRIYNEVGRTIGEGQIKEAYDFSTQPSGIYMLMLQTENGTQYLKVVKQ